MRTCMRTPILSILATSVALLGFCTTNPAAAQQSSSSAKNAKKETTQTVPYLGVAVTQPHPSLISHLRHLFERDQGLLVLDVAKDSPADKAGIEANDILMTAGDQKLFAPEQLAKLVHAEKPGNVVVMNLIHNGEKHQVKVTVGSRRVGEEPTGPEGMMRGRIPMLGRMPRMGQMMRDRMLQNPDEIWENFDSLSMQKVGDNRFKVEIRYEDKNGKIQQHSFEGTRKEIHDAIAAEKDLPENERQHLLRALDLNEPVLIPRLWELRPADFPDFPTPF